MNIVLYPIVLDIDTDAMFSQCITHTDLDWTGKSSCVRTPSVDNDDNDSKYNVSDPEKNNTPGGEKQCRSMPSR